MSTKAKDPVDSDVEEKPKKAQSPLEKLRAAHFNTDPAKGVTGEWNLKWSAPEAGTKFQVHGVQGVLVDEHEKPVVLDGLEGNQFLQELTLARPGDGARLVPVS